MPQDGTLSDERIGEVYAIYLRGAQLTTDTTPMAALPDSITGRADGADSSPVLIAGIKNPVNVNAIPATAELNFGNGLTVVYGHNGAGKSGFARIIAAACFSHSRQRIIPNVYDASASTLPASADILIRRGQGLNQTLPVTQRTEHAVLRRISVFDSAIARVHLAEETPLGFQPAGFDVFDEVVRVIEAITKRLDCDIANRRSENKFVNIFIGESSIKTETDAAALRALAIYGEKEAGRLVEVDGQIAELKTKSPADLIKQREAAKKDLGDLQNKVAGHRLKVGAAACAAFARKVDELKTKIAAAIAASLSDVGSAALSKTGGTSWEIFAKSARLGRDERESYPQVGTPACFVTGHSTNLPRPLCSGSGASLDDEARVVAEKANAALTSAADARYLGGLLDRARQLPRGDRIGAAAAREQPAMRKHEPASPAFAPPQPKQFQELRREHRVAILAALALLDTEEHAHRVDVIDLEVSDLGHT